VQAEHEIRLLRIQELTMRNVLIETSVEVRTYIDELNRFRRVPVLSNDQGNVRCTKPSALSLLACSRSSASHSRVKTNMTSEKDNRMTVLKYHVHAASTNLRSVEREHTNLLQHIREGRKRQFNILKRAFEGCHHHDICSMGIIVAPSSEATTYSI
jgi:hypothetical protein